MKKIRKRRRRSEVGGVLSEVFIVRKVRGQMQLISRPRPKRRKPTPKQKAMRDRFRMATQFAAKMASDPESVALYARGITSKHTTIQMVALRDFMNPPKIHDVVLKGPVIHIHATDDFMVTEVLIMIMDGRGRIVESGNAVSDPEMKDYWTYKMSADVARHPKIAIRVSAYDYPKNRTGLVVRVHHGRVVESDAGDGLEE